MLCRLLESPFLSLDCLQRKIMGQALFDQTPMCACVRPLLRTQYRLVRVTLTPQFPAYPLPALHGSTME